LQLIKQAVFFGNPPVFLLPLHRFGDAVKFIHPRKRESGSNPEQYPLL